MLSRPPFPRNNVEHMLVGRSQRTETIAVMILWVSISSTLFSGRRGMGKTCPQHCFRGGGVGDNKAGWRRRWEEWHGRGGGGGRLNNKIRNHNINSSHKGKPHLLLSASLYALRMFFRMHKTFQHLPGRLPASSTENQGKPEQSQNRAKRHAKPGRHWKTFQKMLAFVVIIPGRRCTTLKIF